MRVQPFAEPLDAGSGRTGVLLCHGFTGSPHSMRPWGTYLVDHGLRVVVPRLPGHGTTWQDLNRTGWQDWYVAVERALLRLRDECDHVVVGGQSMGACLALRLAQTHPSAVHGLMLVNPALWSRDPRLLVLPVLHRVVPSLAAIGHDIHKPGVHEGAYDRTPLSALYSLTRLWRIVAADLPKVTQPLLVFRSLQDHVLDGSSLRLLRSRVGSREIEEHALPDSYHVATLDYDAPTIFEVSRGFVERVCRRAAGARAAGR
ncbi:alpha/beta hydrolase [Thermasporomyces composti]|mgnify:CR=1 FL=1|uniref:Carboxylesterase n=1 Tax=Thermasporomyces composti TaxID=696763 RepID=A0A3D9V9M0_THECX|nr:alpha/beta fold hydrolase [Thermasporomyces composti]REF34854.1 carboxylesterase [Thermasporomyces composti]